MMARKAHATANARTAVRSPAESVTTAPETPATARDAAEGTTDAQETAASVERPETEAAKGGTTAEVVTPISEAPSVPGGQGLAAAAAPEAGAKPITSTAAIMVFGASEKGLPQGSWFPADEVELASKAAGLMGLRVLTVETDEQREIAVQLRAGQVYAADRMFAPIIRQDLYTRLLALVGGPAPAAEVTLPRPTSFAAIEIGSLVLANDGGDEEGWWPAVVIARTDELFRLRWRDSAREPSFLRPLSEIGLMPLQIVAKAAA